MRPISTLVITDRRGTRLNCWNTMAHWARHSRTLRPLSASTPTPSQSIVPDVASVSRLIMRSSVDLPAPERPMMPTIWPLGTSNETSSTATSEPNFLVRRSSFSIFPLESMLAEQREHCQDKQHASDHHRRWTRPPPHADYRERAEVLRRDPRQAHPRLDGGGARRRRCHRILLHRRLPHGRGRARIPAIHLPAQRRLGEQQHPGVPDVRRGSDGPAFP